MESNKNTWSDLTWVGSHPPPLRLPLQIVPLLKKETLSCKWHITAWTKAKSSVGSFSRIPKTICYQLEPDSQVIFLSHKCRSERHKVIWEKAHSGPVRWTTKGTYREYPLAKRLAAPSLLFIPQSRKWIGFCLRRSGTCLPHAPELAKRWFSHNTCPWHLLA